MDVRMGMRFARRVLLAMPVPVVLVVHVRVVVGEQGMLMHMVVALGQIQPDAETHQQGGAHQLRSQWFVEES